MYNSFINGMQSTLGAYMESNIQGGSQKKINRPSDDPAGMALVLNIRNSIDNIKQFERNADTAKGWLNLADETLSNQVSVTLNKIKELGEQASTGTMTPENRAQIALQVRELFGTLLNLSNTSFEGKSLFAGHKYDSNAFEEGLTVDSDDPALAGLTLPVAGKAKYTQLIEFTSGGTVGVDAMDYRWSDDGGTSWKTGTMPAVNPPPPDPAAPNPTITQNGITLTVPHTDANGNPIVITAKDPTQPDGSKNGTVLRIRPTAIYMGDDKDMPPSTNIMGGPPGMSAQVAGTFGTDTFIRFDNTVNLNAGGALLNYSYSTDNGKTWVKAEAQVPNPPTNGVRLPVPGGYMDIQTTAPNTTIPAGTQAIIHPDRAELGYEIMDNTFVSVNSVGKEIFGGMYNGEPVVNGKGNAFEAVGKMLGYLETNNQDGISACLETLKGGMENVLGETARIAGLENRVTLSKDVLSYQKLDRQERLSYTEDVNLSELLTRLAQQQMAYNTVLKSSSMIMQLNLTKFV
ncbi:MAG: flagellar hook protein [Desulfovibrionaceae bacterium]